MPVTHQRQGDRTRRSWRGLLFLALTSCIQYVSPPTEATTSQQLAAAEGVYADARNQYYALYVAEAGGTGRSHRGVSVPELRGTYLALRERALERLAAIDVDGLNAGDRRAHDVMRRTLLADSTQTAGAEESTCPAEGRGWVRSSAALAEALSGCYARAQSRIGTGKDTVDRLTVLARLARDSSSSSRRALFESLRPVWESVNGANTPLSPWRQLLRLQSPTWSGDGLPSDVAARTTGVLPSNVEAMLVGVLHAWERQLPDTLIAPWDWWYRNGAASRRLSRGLTVAELERINEAYYASIGASPMALGIRYDLVPRPGKGAVAFTQFGGSPRRTRDGPQGAQPHVFATYREGGFGNLAELLHETGHAIHIAAIDARPAFADWPDSDPFTEALADVPAMEIYEGPWQVTYLGDSATREDNLREKYSGVIMDVAWALFELRMQRDPARDPNAEWTAITREYLHIAPHPGWSWWAMRGQLIDSPGYMMNYALGAMMVAEMRARVSAKKGGFPNGGPRLYDWLADELYKHGLSRASRDVLQAFLGGPSGVDAIVADINRISVR